MSALNWQIVPDRSTSYGLRVVSPDAPEWAAWPVFFNGFSLSGYPELLEAVAQEIGRGSNGTGVNFLSSFDEYDLAQAERPLAADEVELYAPSFDDSVLPRADFYAILSAFAERLLETNPQAAADWQQAMRAALAQLHAKMEADAAQPSGNS